MKGIKLIRWGEGNSCFWRGKEKIKSSASKAYAVVFYAVVFAGLVLTSGATRYMENLDRGVVAVRTDSNHVYVGWRMLGTEWGKNIGYHVYRNGVRITLSPITTSTNYVHTITTDDSYSISAVIDGVEGSASKPASVWNNISYDYKSYLIVPLQVPAGVTTPDGVTCTYSPNDCSVGDLDGDGEYEIVLKWDPSNSHDNADSGYTGNVYLDAYKLNGTFLWRIDLGINIRAGAHYTQFMVYDLNCDGRAEVACKTAPYTKDGLGNYVLMSGDTLADYRNSSGRILSGPEYLTIFNGQTGAAMATASYVPLRGTVSDWGDSTGNRVDRFLACVAYLDGVRPSLVMCRGYYARTALTAWDWRGGQLIQRWVFDTGSSGGTWSAYKGQGNHNLSVGDVDGDGKDEIVYGACAIDDNGTGLYTTGLGHGDAMHLSDMDPDRPGLEVWQCHEGTATGASFRDAATGQLIFDHYNSGDVGRACAAHIDSRYPGYQLWSYAVDGVYTVDNVQISTNRPAINFLAWWDGDLQREIVDIAGSDRDPKIDKWNGVGVDRLLSVYNWPTSYGCNSINGTKGNPCLSADILGDWREELIYKLRDNTGLIICTTTTATSYRFYSFMHDPQYRCAIAWQNVAYNQPPHPSFYVGTGMSALLTPDIKLVGDTSGTVFCEWWMGITGTAVSDLTSNIYYPDNPGGRGYLMRLEEPVNWTDNYGTRVRGYVIPLQTGAYTFWIASDDNSELWLSSDALPANAAMIASVTGSTTQYQWNKFASQQSALINLTAGHKYYIEILHKEGTGSDHWAVAWQGPGITQQVIGSAYLTPWRGPMTGDITGNGFVNSDDLILFVESWLNMDCTMSPELDLNGDCVIDYHDFTVFAGNWRNDLPQAWWPMNETSGTTVSEVMFGHTGTLQNSPGIWTTGKVGNCLLLDGIDDYVLVSGYKGITGTASRTCTAWIKTNTVSGQVLTWGNYAAGQKWVIRVNVDGTLRAEVQNGYIYGTTSLTDNQWHHIAVVLANDGSLDISEARLYVDGQLETTGGVLAYPINTAGIQDVQLGVFTPLPSYFNGLIDDVRIYNGALTDAEIADLAQ